MRASPEDRVRWVRGHWFAAWGLAAASVFVTRNAWLDTCRLALKDEEVGYVLLAPLFVLWLVWVRRHRLAYCRPGGGWIGACLVGVGWCLWSIGYRRSAPTPWHAGPVLIGAGAFIAVTGRDLARRFLPAFLALAFFIPITPIRRQIVAAPMEKYTAIWTQAACDLLGLHVVRHGNLLSTNGTEVEVAEACNGMRQVISFGLVAYVIAFTRPLHWYIRLSILMAAPVVAAASNIIRLVPTVWVYSHGATARAARFHDIAGWLMLVVAFAMLGGGVATARWAFGPIQRVSLAVS